MRLLELFSGTGSVGKVARERGWDVVSVDLHGATINTDIMEWDYKSYDGQFDVIWASPPCHCFSHLRACWIGRTLKTINNGETVITKDVLTQDILDKGLPLLERAKDIIEHFAPSVWFIENPASGRMDEWMTGIPRITVDYCQYALWGYRKRTHIWTNVANFEPKLCDKTNCPNMNGNRHRLLAVGSTGLSLKDRYRVPPALIEGLFDSIYNINI